MHISSFIGLSSGVVQINYDGDSTGYNKPKELVTIDSLLKELGESIEWDGLSFIENTFENMDSDVCQMILCSTNPLDKVSLFISRSRFFFSQSTSDS